MFAWLSALAMSVMLTTQSSVTASGNGNGGRGPGMGNGNGSPFPRDVPEIDLFSGAAALMILAMLGMLLWERHRRMVRH